MKILNFDCFLSTGWRPTDSTQPKSKQIKHVNSNRVHRWDSHDFIHSFDSYFSYILHFFPPINICYSVCCLVVSTPPPTYIRWAAPLDLRTREIPATLESREPQSIEVALALTSIVYIQVLNTKASHHDTSPTTCRDSGNSSVDVVEREATGYTDVSKRRMIGDEEIRDRVAQWVSCTVSVGSELLSDRRLRMQ